MTTCKLQIWAGALGLSGVGLGAFGAHALNERLAAMGHTQHWQTAVQYQLLHAVGILALAALPCPPGGGRSQTFRWAARCWMLGTVLFSGSLYVLSLGGPRWLGPVTPVGGLALLVGWGLLMFSRPRVATPPAG